LMKELATVLTDAVATAKKSASWIAVDRSSRSGDTQGRFAWRERARAGADPKPLRFQPSLAEPAERVSCFVAPLLPSRPSRDDHERRSSTIKCLRVAPSANTGRTAVRRAIRDAPGGASPFGLLVLRLLSLAEVLDHEAPRFSFGGG